MADVEKSVRCVCSCTIAQFDYWKWDDSDDDFNVDFYTVSRPQLRYRLKNAWAIIRGKDSDGCIHGVALERKQIEEIRDFCNDALNASKVAQVNRDTEEWAAKGGPPLRTA